MTGIKKWPVAMTIAGSDSGGGAGLQADLKTFAAMGVHGTSVITAVTAQNPRGVRAAEAVSPGLLRQQLSAVMEELPPAAIKTGMLFTRGNIEIVADFLKPMCPRKIPLIVDPVMVATSGALLLPPSALGCLRRRLLPLTTLVTPNLAEAAILVGAEIKSIEAMRRAARGIHGEYGCAVLVKGGHLPLSNEAVDVFYDGHNELLLTAPRIKGIRTHGTGCTYSAAICAALAGGSDLPQAVEIAKNFITAAIADSHRMGAHFGLGYPSRLQNKD